MLTSKPGTLKSRVSDFFTRFTDWIREEFGLSRAKTVKQLRSRLEWEREGVKRFKVAVIRFDPDQTQALLRNKMQDKHLWVESDGNRFVVYSDHPFSDGEKNGVIANMPKPEIL